MSDLGRFEESASWQRGMDLCEAVYIATRSFPKEEVFGLTSQLRRAAVSIPSNIAEGQGRLTSPEFLHFLGIARGSAQEVRTQLHLANRLRYSSAEDLAFADALAVEVLKLLNAAIASSRKKLKQVRK